MVCQLADTIITGPSVQTFFLSVILQKIRKRNVVILLIGCKFSLSAMNAEQWWMQRPDASRNWYFECSVKTGDNLSPLLSWCPGGGVLLLLRRILRNPIPIHNRIQLQDCNKVDKGGISMKKIQGNKEGLKSETFHRGAVRC